MRKVKIQGFYVAQKNNIKIQNIEKIIEKILKKMKMLIISKMLKISKKNEIDIILYLIIYWPKNLKL